MRSWVPLLCVTAGFAVPALASRPVSLEQLKTLIDSVRSKADADAAWQIGDAQLTERMSTDEQSRLESQLPGDESRKALQAIADESQFEEPPASRVPKLKAPAFPEQKRIMALVVQYVSKVLPQLPNLFATRETRHFEDTPLVQRTGSDFIPYRPLHYMNTSTVSVMYREGHEVEGADIKAKLKRGAVPREGRLATLGIFGPFLAQVLVDAAKSKLAWGHWEQAGSARVAVFDFEVPKEKSHYEVNYCCVAHESATVVANLAPFEKVVGYRGSFTIDPATGTILRIVVLADLKPTDPVMESAILVDYGPVEIGGKTYICPLRSISRVRAEAVQVDTLRGYALANQQQPLQTLVNEADFTNYHVFRSDAHVLSPEEAELVESTAGPTSAKEAQTAKSEAPEAEKDAAPPDESSAVAASTAAAQPNAPLVKSALTTSPAAPAPVAAATPPPEPMPEIEVKTAKGLPDIPAAQQQAPSTPGFVLRTTSKLVDVTVVALDKKGRPVTDLKQSDFQVYDEGHKEVVRFFTSPEARTQDTSAEPAETEGGSAKPTVFTNNASTVPDGESATSMRERNSTVLMIDASNLAFGDLSYARAEMLRFLRNLAADEPVGLYVLKSYGFQVLREPTTDHAGVAAALGQWMPNAQDLARAQDEEQRNRQHIDWVSRLSDLTYVNGNDNMSPEVTSSSGGGSVAGSVVYPVDARLQDLGSNPERDALLVLPEVAVHLAAISGPKSLVWVSSDNVLANWSNENLRTGRTAKFVDSLYMRAQESLNDAHVSIYPLDASQLEPGGIGADIQNRNVNAVGFNSRSQPGPGGGPTPGFTPGRDIAEMHQDLHSIQGGVRDLANATGGDVLRRAGDIAGELNGIVDDGRAAYHLSFSPEGAADNKYHALTVKVVERRGLKLRYRAGYYYAKEPATMKERIQQAIWRPDDINEIGLSATPRAKQGFVGIKIAAADLDLAQQDGRLMDKLDLIAVVRDDAEHHAQLNGTTMALRLRPATYQKALHDGLDIDEAVPNVPDGSALRIILIDENTGRMGTVTLPASALKPGK